MDVSEILSGLNAAQRDAVTSEKQAIRVIAGAGSGKTRVLVQRMQWLMAVDRLSPYGLLALTFTNKAAREMRSRLEDALQMPLNHLWMGTFHGICLRILRRYAALMDWPAQFVVMDSDDQVRMVKRIMSAAHVDDKYVRPKDIVWSINHFKEEGLRADDVPVSSNPLEMLVRDVYREYERLCRAQGTMDFAELLLLTVELFQLHPDILAEYQRRFSCVLVDEFQDTNGLQFSFIRLLCAGGAKLFVVGDDDQSIYGWRGAKVEHILGLERVFPTLETIRLEQNYRSTQTILDAANAVIAQNTKRLGKTLWSAGEVGEKVQVYPALNEYDEARYVTERILSDIQSGGRFSEHAVLYRSNAQSRVFEELFLHNQVPYRVYGGLRFFERAEIKDALAYLRLVQFPDDDGALERIINQPTRGIGAKTVAQLRELAQQGQCSLWQILTAEDICAQHFSGRARTALSKFVALILAMKDATHQQAKSLEHALQVAIYDSGLYALFEQSRKEEDEARKENLDELLNVGQNADRMAQLNPQEHSDIVMDFLAEAALDAGDGQAGEGEDCVQLMTMHSAKGLEFPHVYIVGMEEGIFPTPRSYEKPSRLEEERRLAYVGMTRARQHLTLTFAERRRWQGQDNLPTPSCFLQEIPEQLIHSVRPMLFSKILSQRTKNNISTVRLEDGRSTTMNIGDIVQHPKFGQGCILALEGEGEHGRALVNFSAVGEKWLVLAYAKLDKVG